MRESINYDLDMLLIVKIGKQKPPVFTGLVINL